MFTGTWNSRTGGFFRNSRPTQRCHGGFKPQLEQLEQRALLSTFFVVRGDQADGKTSFDTLAGALAVASANDTIQIEPNSSPGNGTVSVPLTVQGDPNFGPATLPLIPSLTVLEIGGRGVQLTGLDLGAVTLANGISETVISHCQVQTIEQKAGSAQNGPTQLSGNTITAGVDLDNSTSAPSTGDRVFNNTFVSSSPNGDLLFFESADNISVEDNTFTASGINVGAISFRDSQNVLIRRNHISLNGTVGIIWDNSDRDTSATVTDNFIHAQAPLAEGIQTLNLGGHALSATITGNDLGPNVIGIFAGGDGTTFGNITLTGNDFRGFTSTAGGRAAIVADGGGPSVVLTAQNNIWGVGDPRTVITVKSGKVDISSPLTANQAFVDRLYENFLKRPGSLSELNGWVSLIPSLGTAGVASAIIHSGEADARLVDQLYLQFLGRPADPGGESAWVGFLQAGHTEEDLLAALLSSSEFYNRAPALANFASPDDPDADFVRALYETLLGRAGDNGEISDWVVQLPSVGRAGVINGIAHSLEYRTDEVASFYLTFLHRGGSAKEVAGFAGGSLDLLSIETVFVGSNEFFTNG